MNSSIERLVRLLPENDVGAILNLMHNIAADHRETAPEAVNDTNAPLTGIGVWRRSKNNDNRFQRHKDPIDEWKTWADEEFIELKKDCSNIAFIGESVARGFLYDPFLTPAGILQNLLNQYANQKHHVIDLARTNMGFFESLALCRQATKLPCDHIVYFGGNNWLITGDVYGFAETAVLAEQLRRGDLAAYGASLAAAVEKQTLHLLKALGKIKKDQNIRITLVIPAFNLKDWKPGFGNLPPLITPERLETWLALKATAQSMMKQDRLMEAESILDQMLTLDQQSCCDSLHLMGQLHQRQGRYESAGRYFSKAKDAYGVLPVLQAPGFHEQLRQTVMEHHQRYDIDIVDLPGLFARLAPDGIPDRTLLLDYCHLNKKGMTAAMTATAIQICRNSEPFDGGPKQLHTLDAVAEAGAYFLAAIHNANWGQGSEIISFYCQKAYETCPDAAQRLFIDYLHFETASVPRWACRSFERFDLKQARRYKSFSQNPRLADFSLKEAMLAVLETADNEAAAEQWMQQLKTVRGIGDEPVNLLTPCYSERFHGENHPYHVQRGYTQFCRPRSDFFLVCRQTATLVLTLVWKTPIQQDAGPPVRILCNEQEVATIASSKQWQKTVCDIQEQHLRTGINVLQLVWPAYRGDHKEACERAAWRMERKQPMELFPVFGQIHRLTVRQKPCKK